MRQTQASSSANARRSEFNSAASSFGTNQSAPPPYSAVNPLHSAAYNPTSAKIQQTSKNVPVSKPVNPSSDYCLVCQGFHATNNCPVQARYANNPFPAGVPYQKPPTIPPLPQKKQEINPYRWTRESSQPLNVDLNQPTYQHKKPSPKTTPSPNYDSLHNPYVWVNNNPEQPASPTKNVKVVDLNQELPKIYERIKENKMPSYQHLSKQLMKNKPPTEVRSIMVNNKYLSDVVFIIDGSQFYGHKMFLITASHYFYDHFHVKDEKKLVVDSIDLETFEKVIAYCYTDQITVTEDNVLELLLASNKLQVKQITNICSGFISNMMNYDSVFVIFEKALELNNENFVKKCLDYINSNEGKCFASKGFFAIPLPSLIKILGACKYPPEKSQQITMKYMAGSMEASFPDPLKNPPPKPVQPKLKTAQQQQQKQDQPLPKKKNKPPKAAQQPKGAIKKAQGKNSIPDLMSLPLPNFNSSPAFHNGPPMSSPFPFPPPNMHQSKRQFHGSCQNISNMNQPLINFDDDDDDKASIISKDDDVKGKVKVNVFGSRNQWNTQFSRLDFVCKRSMLLHDIWFSEDLAKSCTIVEVTIGVFENNQRNNIHNRTIKVNKGENLILT